MSRLIDELNKLKESDFYSLLLFVLYKIIDIPEYSTLSEMSYVLDKENLLNLCEYFGGMTIRIPTIKEMEDIVYALLLFEYVDIRHIDFEEALSMVKTNDNNLRKLKTNYFNLKEILSNYGFSAR